MKFMDLMPTLTVRTYCVLPYLPSKYEQSDRSKRLNGLVFALKDASEITDGKKSLSAAEAFAKAAHSSIGKWVTPETVWLPLPGSGVSSKSRADEKTVLFAAELSKRFGGKVDLGLVRTTAVNSSHRGTTAQRPSVQAHRDSMELKTKLADGAQVILVDDVLTRGNTVAGAALLLQDIGATGTVRLVAGAYSRFPDEGDAEHTLFNVTWRKPEESARKSRVSELEDEEE